MFGDISMTGFMKIVSIIWAKSPIFHFDFTPPSHVKEKKTEIGKGQQ